MEESGERGGEKPPTASLTLHSACSQQRALHPSVGWGHLRPLNTYTHTIRRDSRWCLMGRRKGEAGENQQQQQQQQQRLPLSGDDDPTQQQGQAQHHLASKSVSTQR